MKDEKRKVEEAKLVQTKWSEFAIKGAVLTSGEGEGTQEITCASQVNNIHPVDQSGYGFWPRGRGGGFRVRGGGGKSFSFLVDSIREGKYPMSGIAMNAQGFSGATNLVPFTDKLPVSKGECDMSVPLLYSRQTPVNILDNI